MDEEMKYAIIERIVRNRSSVSDNMNERRRTIDNATSELVRMVHEGRDVKVTICDGTQWYEKGMLKLHLEYSGTIRGSSMLCTDYEAQELLGGLLNLIEIVDEREGEQSR